ncbi:hypothetical protein [Heliorestis convoluta]|uniref:Putative major facilitator superfamily protein n=1 Tax=Heliorestis convoluta TaxID=356322 RepID=A0A5Q2MXY7_9FIRM|nr:hypothetical protein [Heliorestis convoluta]QGG47704.1 putative major facilitator superfamily protein [Heliorestis convoluta]
MRKHTFLFVGLVLAITGYFFGLNENMKWLTLAFYLLGAICFVIQAVFVIKNQKR